MEGRYRAYPEYKDSGVEWLGDIPSQWAAKKLKFIASNMPSNIDKKVKVGETPIGLCNYTDVYYSDVIDPDTAFMRATATSEQIDKFTLRAGDTIITKDSEDPNDIAIPAYVSADLQGIVCGYHLSVIRPFIPKTGGYIKRCFECGFARSYFAVNANGLTRYGLGAYPLDNVIYPVPSEKEQTQIAAFLDHETAKIDGLIAKQQRLIALLEEKRQAVISHAVTKGLNPDAPLRPSGIDWLGDIPAHWEVLSLNRIIEQFVDYRGKTPTKTEEGVPLITATQIKRGAISHELDPVFISHQEYRERMTRGFPAKGDLLLTTEAPLGEVALIEDEFVATGQRIILMKCAPKYILSDYLLRHFQSQFGQLELYVRSSGSTASGIRADRLRASKVAIPPVNEQSEIVKHIEQKLSKFELLEADALKVTTLLKERRTALISAAVTGKIDVRDWTPPLAKDEAI